MTEKLAGVHLLTNDESKTLILSAFVGNKIELYRCEVEVFSAGFGFKGDFYFDNFSEFVVSIERMSSSLSGSAELREIYQNQAIRLELLNLGRVLISGQIERHKEHSQTLSFGFITDQTCLMPFAKDLRKALDSM